MHTLDRSGIRSGSAAARRFGVLTAAALLLFAGTAIAQRGAASRPANAQAAQAAQGQLPLRSVTLYRSGVGAFLREGRVTGSETVTLQFGTDQVNDILKSMVVLDLDGGSVDAVTYGSKQPLSRRLEAFGIDISGAPSVADLLSQLAGEHIMLYSTLRAPIAGGTILSVERKTVPVTNPSGDGLMTMTRSFVNLWTDAGLRSVELDQVGTFELSNEALAEDLGRALATLAEFRAERRTGVDVHLSGEGNAPRRVVIGYTHEMPMWKASYRLVLPEDSGAGEVDEDGVPLTKATVQGWAIVENTTDNDWNNIRLSLASGRPVSFTMNLHESLFMERPEMPVPGIAPLAGREYKSALPQSPAFAPSDSMRSRRAGAVASERAATSAGQEVIGLSSLAFDTDAVSIQSIGPGQASGDEVGGQFMYTVDAPVTINRGQSSMLPIIVTEIPARHVSIYNANDMPKHPMKGVELNNTTGLHLMPGPIAVYDGNTYSGDSQIPHTSRNQTRLMSYALDIDVFVEREVASNRRTSRIRVVDGLLEHTIRHTASTTYKLQNFDANRDRTVLIEHQAMPGWDLTAPAQAKEVVDGLHRFELVVPRTGRDELSVAFERTELQRITLMNWTAGQFLDYVTNNDASPRLVEAAREASRIQADINLINQQISAINDRLDEIDDDQQRIRNNLSRLDRDSDLRQRYLATLNSQEDEIVAALERRDNLRKSLADREEALREFLRNLDVE